MSLSKNTLWNLLGSGLPILAALAFIPYCLNQLGSETFGVLALVWSLIGYFSLFDFGVGRALTVDIGRLRRDVSSPDIAPVILSGLALTLVTGLLGGLVLWELSPHLAGRWLNIAEASIPDATSAFQIAALGVVLTTLTSGLRGAQEGLEDFRSANLTKMFLGFCTFSLPAWSIYMHGPVLNKIVIYLVFARLIGVVINAYQLRACLHWVKFEILLAKGRGLCSFGLWVSVSSIVGPLMVYGDRFFVSAAVGAALLPLYAIPQEALQRLLLVPSSFCGALLPKLAMLEADERRALYSASYKKVGWVMLALCGASALLAYPALSIWISPEFAQNALGIVLVLCVGIWINAMAFVPFTFLHSEGRARVTAIFHVVELFVYVFMLYLLVDHFGLIGAALAWTIRVFLDWMLLIWAVRNDIN